MGDGHLDFATNFKPVGRFVVYCSFENELYDVS